MQKYKVLVLTDHSNHSAENSLYSYARVMQKHPNCLQLDVATRGNAKNKAFFEGKEEKELYVNKVDDSFSFHKDGHSFYKNLRKEQTSFYDLIWLRLPPPLSHSFLTFLDRIFVKQFVINSPLGIYTTGSKAFLINFPAVSPPTKICRSVEDIIAFKKQFPIVLKPFREYGGKGIVKINGDKVSEGKQEISFHAFIDKIKHTEIAYLGVKFLEKVYEGDKRIIVVNGKIMGASLRRPPKDSWICNVSMGGSASLAVVNEEEKEIVRLVNPKLSEMGIVMYGIDTLMGDNGKRILSEINTTSIGGLPQIAKEKGEPLVEETIDLIWTYFLKNK